MTLLTLVLSALLSAHPQRMLKALQDGLLLPTVEEPYIGVAWTLQHELLFYLVLAIGIINRRAGAAAFSAWL